MTLKQALAKIKLLEEQLEAEKQNSNAITNEFNILAELSSERRERVAELELHNQKLQKQISGFEKKNEWLERENRTLLHENAMARGWINAKQGRDFNWHDMNFGSLENPGSKL